MNEIQLVKNQNIFWINVLPKQNILDELFFFALPKSMVSKFPIDQFRRKWSIFEKKKVIWNVLNNNTIPDCAF